MTDTSELVRRLRFWMPIGSKHLEEDLVLAAERLEAMEAQNKRLREALGCLLSGAEQYDNEPDCDLNRARYSEGIEAARAALREEK